MLGQHHGAPYWPGATPIEYFPGSIIAPQHRVDENIFSNKCHAYKNMIRKDKYKKFYLEKLPVLFWRKTPWTVYT